MALKLLQKHEVDALKAKERELEVRQGAKLAKSVDELRKMEAEEKTRITLWRNTTLETIKGEIAEAVKERDTLRFDVQALTLKKGHEHLPLNSVWRSIALAKADNERKGNELKRQEQEIQEQIRRSDLLARQTSLDKSRTDDERERAQEMLSIAAQARENAHQELADARNMAQSLTVEAQLRDQQSLDREQKVRTREEEVAGMFAWVTTKEGELTAQEKNLRARYKDLEQTAERIKKGNL